MQCFAFFVKLFLFHRSLCGGRCQLNYLISLAFSPEPFRARRIGRQTIANPGMTAQGFFRE
jgi:hypothetical protein